MDNSTNTGARPAIGQSAGAKYCKYCGELIPWEAVICVHCGCQVEQLKSEQPQVVINNTNDSRNDNSSSNISDNKVDNSSASLGGYAAIVDGRAKSKWVALTLCFFLGYLGAHKFYEDKVGVGILYLLTMGLFGIGWVVDFISLLFRSNPYYVR